MQVLLRMPDYEIRRNHHHININVYKPFSIYILEQRNAIMFACLYMYICSYVCLSVYLFYSICLLLYLPVYIPEKSKV